MHLWENCKGRNRSWLDLAALWSFLQCLTPYRGRWETSFFTKSTYPCTTSSATTWQMEATVKGHSPASLYTHARTSANSPNRRRMNCGCTGGGFVRNLQHLGLGPEAVSGRAAFSGIHLLRDVNMWRSEWREAVQIITINSAALKNDCYVPKGVDLFRTEG